MSTEDSKSHLIGLSGTNRARLGQLIRAARGPITVKQAVEAWSLTPRKTSQLLARLAAHGWLQRVRRGIYLPVPLESKTTQPMAEDAWVVANALFKPCYIGGWSAAEHWELTEQVFSETIVLTSRRSQQRLVGGAGARFRLKTIRPSAMFGFIEVWRGNVKVPVSTPAKTLVDMLDDPGLAGGVRTLADMLSVYLKSPRFKESDLSEACVQFDSGAVFKRLGFLLERSGSGQARLLELCRGHLTQGTAKLDPTLECRRLIARWKLWVPESWLGATND